MVEIHNNRLIACIDETGAQLTALTSKTTQYIWNGNTEIWAKHAPVLFPFVGRLKDQKYRFNGKDYGPVRIHGFAPYAEYMPADKTESSVRMIMKSDDEIRKIWPYDFSFSVLFELVDYTLKITYEVQNLGKETMYYGIGSHPGFNVPLTEGLRFEDYYIDFPEACGIQQNVMSEACLNTGKQKAYQEITGTRLNLRHSLFDDDAVILSNTGTKAVLGSDKDNKKIIVEYPDTDYCAIWHKVRMDAPFVCIEPWTSLPGEDDGITVLEEKKDFNSLLSCQSREHHLNISVIE